MNRVRKLAHLLYCNFFTDIYPRKIMFSSNKRKNNFYQTFSIRAYFSIYAGMLVYGTIRNFLTLDFELDLFKSF